MTLTLQTGIAVPSPNLAMPARPIAGPALFERAGPFEIRLAADGADVEAAQRLRYRVFFAEGGAVADDTARRAGRDLCDIDAHCDHLLVFDAAADRPGGLTLAGTYRLLRREVAEARGGFYSQAEFDLAPLLARHPAVRFLELGRSCVHPAYRAKRVIELLWRGLWLYAQHHRVDALIGCASLPGADLEANRLALSFLHHHARAGRDWAVLPRPSCAVPFEPLPAAEVDGRRGLLALPPLVKAYLRAGALFSCRPVLDRQFGTTDVFAAMPMVDLDGRYRARYGQPSCLSEPSAA